MPNAGMTVTHAHRKQGRWALQLLRLHYFALVVSCYRVRHASPTPATSASPPSSSSAPTHGEGAANRADLIAPCPRLLKEPLDTRRLYQKHFGKKKDARDKHWLQWRAMAHGAAPRG